MKSSKPVAWVAILKDADSFSLANKAFQATCHVAAVSHLEFYTQKVESHSVVFAIMDIDQGAQPEQVWREIEATDAFCEIQQNVLPHPRHVGTGKSPWVLAETVCELRLDNAAPATANSTWHTAVTGLKREKEAEYRLLHDNVWPGVKLAIGASNISRFDVFLIELGDNQPYLFYSFQFTGNDFEKDMRSQSDSPVNQRWWKYTDACQQPLPEAKGGPWLDLNTL